MTDATPTTRQLTPKQEAFAQAVADGNTQADAYRKAFNVSPSTKPETIQKRASELMTRGEVAGRVSQLRKQLSDKAIWTREDSIRTLAEIASGGSEDVKASDRVNAVKAINAMHGWDAAQKIDHTTSDGSMSPTGAKGRSLDDFYADHPKGEG